MSELIYIAESGEPFTTSEAIAEGAGVSHRAVLQLVGKHQRDLEVFGGVAFKIHPFATPGGQQKKRVAHLNERQATLLLTWLRNTEPVRQFKVNLVKAFYEMAEQLNQVAPTPEKSVEEKALEVVQGLQEIVATQRGQLEELAPKVEAYEALMGTDGSYSVGEVAKMLGMSQQRLFKLLRQNKVLIPKGHMRNTPYQKYMEHFEVKAKRFFYRDGTEGMSHTTRVLPEGLEFVREVVAA